MNSKPLIGFATMIKSLRKKSERIALKKHEAAFVIGVSDETLNKWVKEGNIPVCKIDGCVLFPVEILKSFVLDNEKISSKD